MQKKNANLTLIQKRSKIDHHSKPKISFKDTLNKPKKTTPPYHEPNIHPSSSIQQIRLLLQPLAMKPPKAEAAMAAAVARPSVEREPSVETMTDGTTMDDEGHRISATILRKSRFHGTRGSRTFGASKHFVKRVIWGFLAEGLMFGSSSVNGTTLSTCKSYGTKKQSIEKEEEEEEEEDEGGGEGDEGLNRRLVQIDGVLSEAEEGGGRRGSEGGWRAMISMELPAHTTQHGALHLGVGVGVNPGDPAGSALTAIHPHPQDPLALHHHNHGAATPGGMHEDSKKKQTTNRGVILPDIEQPARPGHFNRQQILAYHISYSIPSLPSANGGQSEADKAPLRHRRRYLSPVTAITLAAVAFLRFDKQIKPEKASKLSFYATTSNNSRKKRKSTKTKTFVPLSTPPTQTIHVTPFASRIPAKLERRRKDPSGETKDFLEAVDPRRWEFVGEERVSRRRAEDENEKRREVGENGWTSARTNSNERYAITRWRRTCRVDPLITAAENTLVLLFEKLLRGDFEEDARKEAMSHELASRER
ncbi:hypothetical protein WH47_08210 [Habropoda laboriosa]|uniref:Uncharacterized protein n=1 Tax=Habropoda laboriosa TaxID=597456 RepID=A0A0L7RGK0_9HYME|nr:hypothetical protein WH47_08210 [Habropoda laboriosa]